MKHLYSYKTIVVMIVSSLLIPYGTAYSMYKKSKAHLLEEELSSVNRFMTHRRFCFAKKIRNWDTFLDNLTEKKMHKEILKCVFEELATQDKKLSEQHKAIINELYKKSSEYIEDPETLSEKHIASLSRMQFIFKKTTRTKPHTHAISEALDKTLDLLKQNYQDYTQMTKKEVDIPIRKLCSDNQDIVIPILHSIDKLTLYLATLIKLIKSLLETPGNEYDKDIFTQIDTTIKKLQLSSFLTKVAEKIIPEINSSKKAAGQIWATTISAALVLLGEITTTMYEKYRPFLTQNNSNEAEMNLAIIVKKTPSERVQYVNEEGETVATTTTRIINTEKLEDSPLPISWKIREQVLAKSPKTIADKEMQIQ